MKRALPVLLLSFASAAACAQGVTRIVVPFAAGMPRATVDQINLAVASLLRADFDKMARVVKASGARVE